MWINLYNWANADANPNAKRRRGGTMSVFTKSILNIPSGKILDKNYESFYWRQTFG